MTLNATQKRFIVERFALWMGPVEIAREFEEAFGEPITKQQVSDYDPERAARRPMISKDLIELFEKIRADAIENVARIPIANKAYRLGLLNAIAVNGFEAADRLKAIDQAAKEMGGYVEHRDITSGGKAITALGLLREAINGITDESLAG